MRATEATWESIEPLVADVEVHPHGVEATFRCERSGVTASGFGKALHDGPAQGASQGFAAKGAAMAGGRLMGSVREGIGRSVRRAVMRGSLPGGVGSAAYRATAKLSTPDTARLRNRGGGGDADGDGQDDVQEAVLAAFVTVADRFEFDPATGTWVGRGAAAAGGPAAGGPVADPATAPEAAAGAGATASTAAAPATAAAGGARTFASQLEAFPVTADLDRGVLFRILAAVVAGDGDVGEHEEAVFAGMAPDTDLAALLSLGMPGPFELARVSSPGVKETILLLAWSVALTDERLGSGESAVLEQVASGLGVAAGTVAELRGIAQGHVLEQARSALAAAGWTDEQAAGQLAAIAASIGADPP